ICIVSLIFYLFLHSFALFFFSLMPPPPIISTLFLYTTLFRSTKKDLIALGYGPSFSADIIRECKKLMISKGHTYYQSKKLDRVPKEAVEEVLGITLDV